MSAFGNSSWLAALPGVSRARDFSNVRRELNQTVNHSIPIVDLDISGMWSALACFM
jgi:hypothetical protein